MLIYADTHLVFNDLELLQMLTYTPISVSGNILCFHHVQFSPEDSLRLAVSATFSVLS